RDIFACSFISCTPIEGCTEWAVANQLIRSSFVRRLTTTAAISNVEPTSLGRSKKTSAFHRPLSTSTRPPACGHHKRSGSHLIFGSLPHRTSLLTIVETWSMREDIRTLSEFVKAGKNP